jgi:ankyrin repeat protein
MPSYEEAYGQSAAQSAQSAHLTSQNTQQPNASPATPSNASSTTLPPAALALASTLFDLARSGTTPALEQYLVAGIPKNLTNASGDTLLMLASYHGHADTARMLIEQGADANVLNGRGQSPIAGAVFKGYDDVVRILYEGGADVGLGQPSAVECARMFKRGNCLKLFGVEDVN